MYGFPAVLALLVVAGSAIVALVELPFFFRLLLVLVFSSVQAATAALGSILARAWK